MKLELEEQRERNAAEAASAPEFLAEAEGGRAPANIGFEPFAASQHQQHDNAAFETEDKPPSYDTVVKNTD